MLFTSRLFIKIAPFLLNTILRSESCVSCTFFLRNNSYRRLNVSSRAFIRIVAFHNYKQLLTNKDVISYNVPTLISKLDITLTRLDSILGFNTSWYAIEARIWVKYNHLIKAIAPSHYLRSTRQILSFRQ